MLINKYLGIHLHQCLKWSTHINYINSKIRKTIYKFKRLSFISSHPSHLKNLKIIIGIVENVVSYDVNIYGTLHKSEFQILNVTFKK